MIITRIQVADVMFNSSTGDKSLTVKGRYCVLIVFKTNVVKTNFEAKFRAALLQLSKLVMPYR